MVLDASRSPSAYPGSSALKSPLLQIPHPPLVHPSSPRINRFPVRLRFMRTPLNTPEPPQTLSHHAIAHTFRHTWGVPFHSLSHPFASFLFHSPATPRSPLAAASPHSNARKSIPFTPLLHSSLYTRVGVSSVIPSQQKPCRNIEVLPLRVQPFAMARKRRSDSCQNAWKVK